jgi:valyl-tRNA synthetase
MKGFNVFYPFGFDDNGLPTERLVEKKHGIKAHETTRENFTNLCLEETTELEKQFKKLFISAGFSCDWGHEYSTISYKAQKTSQKSFIDEIFSFHLFYIDFQIFFYKLFCRNSVIIKSHGIVYIKTFHPLVSSDDFSLCI